jgi:hypothetical protein
MQMNQHSHNTSNLLDYSQKNPSSFIRMFILSKTIAIGLPHNLNN